MTETLERSRPAAPLVAPGVRALAGIEARRYLRHPLFLVGLFLAALFSWGLPGPEELDYHVIPSFFIGVLGIAVAARLTASTRRSAPVVDAAPVDETTRTAAMCLAALVPTVAGLLVVLEHKVSMLIDPEDSWMLGGYGPTDRFFITVVVPVVACAGGPLLGVAVGRWLRFPGAPLLTIVAVLLWGNVVGYLPGSSSMDPSSLGARLLHLAGPFTAFAMFDGDGERPVSVVTSFTGSPSWFGVWTLALCGLAVCAALWHGADAAARRTVVRAFLGLGALALVAYVLAVANGNQQNVETRRPGTVAVAPGSSR